MSQCKRDGCREQAVATGERLCPAHSAALKAKRGKYERDVQKSADDLKEWQLDQAETVEHLKDWIREYLP